jgi:acetoin utilization deacetylase AcuC-like enzyme
MGRSSFDVLGFAYMTRQLMGLADGKLALVLEGGYELTGLAECAQHCIEALLNRPVIGKRSVVSSSMVSFVFTFQLRTFNRETNESKPNVHAVRCLEQVIRVQRRRRIEQRTVLVLNTICIVTFSVHVFRRILANDRTISTFDFSFAQTSQ